MWMLSLHSADLELSFVWHSSAVWRCDDICAGCAFIWLKWFWKVLTGALVDDRLVFKTCSQVFCSCFVRIESLSQRVIQPRRYAGSISRGVCSVRCAQMGVCVLDRKKDFMEKEHFMEFMFNCLCLITLTQWDTEVFILGLFSCLFFPSFHFTVFL